MSLFCLVVISKSFSIETKAHFYLITMELVNRWNDLVANNSLDPPTQLVVKPVNHSVDSMMWSQTTHWTLQPS